MAFPRMAAVVRHHGADTTSEALLAGVPNAVVAFGGTSPTTGAELRPNGASSPLTA